MPVGVAQSILIIVLVALTTFVTRAIPFLLFPKGKEIPKVIEYLGKVLTPAVIGMLVIYCLKEISFFTASYGIPEILSVGLVTILHIWKRNNLLSIGAGTLFYMFLVQSVFL